jgi:hypothetical protein
MGPSNDGMKALASIGLGTVAYALAQTTILPRCRWSRRP